MISVIAQLGFVLQQIGNLGNCDGLLSFERHIKRYFVSFSGGVPCNLYYAVCILLQSGLLVKKIEAVLEQSNLYKKLASDITYREWRYRPTGDHCFGGVGPKKRGCVRETQRSDPR